MVSRVRGQKQWSVWLVDRNSSQSGQWTERVVSLVSGQKQWAVWSVDRNSGQSAQWTETASGHSGQWTERAATVVTNFGRPHMFLARQVCLCGTSAFLKSIYSFGNLQIHS